MMMMMMMMIGAGVESRVPTHKRDPFLIHTFHTATTTTGRKHHPVRRSLSFSLEHKHERATSPRHAFIDDTNATNDDDDDDAFDEDRS